MKSIINFIPVGQKNAIKIEQLELLTHCCNRTVREELKRCSKIVPIINLQDGNGYFIPADNELNLEIAFAKQERNRANEILKIVNFVELDIENKKSWKKVSEKAWKDMSNVTDLF